MIVAVASGKGGTGKTMVAVSLIQSLRAERPMCVDCDVEEPNAALFLHPTIVERHEVGRPTPVIDAERCTACGRCAEVCQYHALAVVNARVLVFPELCHACGSCTLVCPEGAISEQWRIVGVVERGTVGEVAFVQGILDVGEAMPSPVIRAAKQLARQASRPDQLVVLDGPPGTSCPVVECMRGADFVLLVTEPTPFGLHDLRLAVEVAQQLHKPIGVIINRDGVGNSDIDAYCQAEGLPVLMRIPLLRGIAEAYSDGASLVESLPEYEARFKQLYQDMLALARDGAGHRREAI